MSCRLINKVDCLIGKVSVCNISFAENNGCLQHTIGNTDSVELLVVMLDALKYLTGVLNAWLVDGNRLESSFKSGILFDILAVL